MTTLITCKALKCATEIRLLATFLRKICSFLKLFLFSCILFSSFSTTVKKVHQKVSKSSQCLSSFLAFLCDYFSLSQRFGFAPAAVCPVVPAGGLWLSGPQ